MAVYYKNGVKYVGSAAEREMAKDNKKTTTSTNTSSGGSTSTSTNKPSGSVTSSVSRDTSSGGNSQYTQGNYVIGSDYGKQQAQNMAVGTSWTATDGSIWTKESDGTVTVRHNGTETKGAYTPTTYTAAGTYNDANLSAWAKNQINYYKEQYNNAIAKGDTKAAEEAHLAAEAIRESYGYSGGLDGSQYIALPDDSFEYEEERPEYENKYDPQIEALLNEILNREDFSYDAMSDPLYQQYANMYRREGDRAMKETLAEAAASAGGMNTYAITAAQQANSYYNSQLNDKIPELYQLAYEMYLQDKESKVQDLGLLQNMDATQYNRYRDTMTDWKDDRNFAYGIYKDDVEQGNWEKTFNNNNYWANKEFDYNDFWANKNFNYNDEWKNKEWDESQSDKEYDRNLYDQESAKEEVWKYIQLGVTPSADLIAKAGMTEADVNLAVAAIKAEQTKSGSTSSSRSYSYDDGEYEGDEKKKVEDEDEGYIGNEDENEVTYKEAVKAGEDLPTALPITQTASVFQAAVEACEYYLKTGGKPAVLDYLAEAAETGALDSRLYAILLNKYGK